MDTLFHRIGGAAALEAAVAEFYRRVLADPVLAPLFAGVDTARLQQHQRQFLALAMGGPSAYAGRNLGAAHRQLVKRHGLGDTHFDRVVQHLGDALGALGVDPGLRSETVALAESVRDSVLGRSAAAAHA